MRRTYIIPDPHDDYAAHIIRTVFYKYGLKPICLYTDRKQSFYRRQKYPLLQSHLIEASYCVPDHKLGEFAAEVRRRYQILGVMPFIEQCVEVSARLCDLLHLDWNSGETLRRFRDKFAMKEHLRQHAPDLRTPHSWLVRGVNDVFPAVEGWPGFVIKPNDGVGNRNVGIFRARTSCAAVEAHLSRPSDGGWVLEEFIGGREFSVNGQVGINGEAIVFVILEYQRTTANGREAVSDKSIKVDQTDPLFEPLSDYGKKVINALGLRRSPFHMEVKVDEQGPCLIDLGARLVGNGCAFMCSRLHRNRPDILDMAAHGYLFDDSYGVTEPVDWSYYNAHSYVRQYGIAERDELISDLHGIDEVEALPEFVHWEVKPHLGQRVHKTMDLFTIPYALDLMHEGSRDDLLRVAARVREMIGWNRSFKPSQLLAASAEHLAARAENKTRWLMHRYLHLGGQDFAARGL